MMIVHQIIAFEPAENRRATKLFSISNLHKIICGNMLRRIIGHVAELSTKPVNYFVD